MAAKTGTLSILHEMMAELLITEITVCKEEGIPMSASDKAVIIKFLKDNNITADVDAEDMKRLQGEFSDELSLQREAKRQLMAAKADSNVDPLESIL